MLEFFTLTCGDFPEGCLHLRPSADRRTPLMVRPDDLSGRRSRARDVHFLDCIAQRIYSTRLLIGHRTKTESKSKGYACLDD
jgi:hypothetical protein